MTLFISFWTSDGRTPRAWAGFLPRVGRSDANVGSRCWGNAASRGSELLALALSVSLSLLRSHSLPLLSSPLSADRWARWPGQHADSAICAGARMQRRASRRPLPASPTPPTHFPVLAAPPVSYFGISCLNSSFRLLHFKLSLF